MTDPTRNTNSHQQLHTLLFAGGGTGGHLYPGIAIAEQIKRISPVVQSHFICSVKPLDRHILAEEGLSFHPVSALPLLLRPLPSAPLNFIRGWLRAERESGKVFDHLLRHTDNPRALRLILMGGYIAPPVARAAARRGIPITLCNLDVVPGKANRLAARWADDIVSAVHCERLRRISHAPVLGMPVRSRAVATGSREECRARLGLRPDLHTLLITGASQGAQTFNRLLVDMTADPRYCLFFTGWQVLHLTGADGANDIREHYLEHGIEAVVFPYCNDMGDAWGSADLAISRAGASSVAEAEVNAVPTVFLPYPWHKDDHQWKNAERLSTRHGAWVMRDAINSSENLSTVAPLVAEIMSDESLRQKARIALEGGKSRNAAEKIALRILEYYV